MPLLDPLTRLGPSATASGPVGSRRIDVVWAQFPTFGGGDAVPLYHRYYQEGVGWVPQDGWFPRGGQWSSAVTVGAFSEGRIEVFGLGPDGGLQHVSAFSELLDGPGPWLPVDALGTPPGEVIVTAPGTAVFGPTSPVAVVRTTDNGRPDWSFALLEPNPTPDNPFAFVWEWQSYLQLQDRFWPYVETNFATAPALVRRYAGALDLFVVNDANQLMHSGISGGPGTRWAPITQPTVTSSPAAVVWQNEQTPADSWMHVVSCYGPFPGPEGFGAVLLKSSAANRWSDDILIYINGDSSIGDGRTVWSPPAVASWGEPRLDVFFVSIADDSGNDPQMTHGWTEAPDQPGLWGWELFPLPG
jgi:hypothetical protein